KLHNFGDIVLRKQKNHKLFMFVVFLKQIYNQLVVFLAFLIETVSSSAPSSKSIKISSPEAILEVMISSAKASSTYFCIARFKGRAPNCLSKPLSAIKLIAFSDNFKV